MAKRAAVQVGDKAYVYRTDIDAGADTPLDEIEKVLSAFASMQEENRRLVEGLKEVRFEAGCQFGGTIAGKTERGDGYRYIYQVAYRALNHGRTFGVDAR